MDRRRRYKYSVLVQRPDYMTDGDRTDTYFAHVSARNPQNAGSVAMQEAALADGRIESILDYSVLLIIKGHVYAEADYIK